MREIFSVRFFAAVGGVVGLFFLLTTIFATREVIDGGDSGPAAVELHRIDFVDQVFSSRNENFALTVDGVAANDTELIIDGSRSLYIVADTPGEMLCPAFPAVGECAVVADLLGEAVVWFALVPSGNARTVDLPAIDTLDDGIATLVNGWQVPFAPVLDRRCDREFASYREFREILGDDFISVFGIDDRELIAVECDVTVDYAPEVTVPATTVSGGTAPDGIVPPDVTVPPPPSDTTPDAALTDALRSALVGLPLDDAQRRLGEANWSWQAVDVDDPDSTILTDIVIGRVLLRHRAEVVIDVEPG